MTVVELQDEICAIDSIYPGSATEMAPQIYKIKVPQHEDLQIQISFPVEYPLEIPGILQVTTTNANIYTDLNYLETSFKEILKQSFHEGEVCLFDFFLLLEPEMEKYALKMEEQKKLVQEQTTKIAKKDSKEINPDRYKNRDKIPTNSNKQIKSEEKSNSNDLFKDWSVSDPIEDRGSVFIGFAKEVHSVEEAECELDKILVHKTLAKATHNMNAWRIKGDNGVQWQDFDDDGETAAGGRMLHLLQMMDVWNVIVVVTRKFGGIHLGPDRFKHINSAARDAVVKGGFFKN